MPMDHGITLLNRLLSCSPVVTAAMASDCGLIILPITPPMVLAAKNRSGVTPAREALDWAASYCRLENSAFAEVSEPVTAVPTQPSTGERTANSEPV